MPIQVLLADDQQVVRQGIRVFLEKEGFVVVGEAADGREAVRLAETIHPDVVILEIALPVLNGLDAAREIVRARSGTKAILLTTHPEDAYVLEALRAGVNGYVLKTQAAPDLVQAINEVSRGGFYLCPGVARAVVEAYRTRAELPADQLSPRERQVLQLVAEGKTTKEAAAILGVSVKTIESHRMHVKAKLGIRETAGLVRCAIRQGLIQL